MQRWPSHMRHELVDAAGSDPELPETTVPAGGDVEDALVIADVGYTHAVMVQCFLPQRPIAERTYDTTHGRAALSIEAGRLINPLQDLRAGRAVALEPSRAGAPRHHRACPEGRLCGQAVRHRRDPSPCEAGDAREEQVRFPHVKDSVKSGNNPPLGSYHRELRADIERAWETARLRDARTRPLLRVETLTPASRALATEARALFGRLRTFVRSRFMRPEGM